ncbi:hypothetical protein PIB30_092564 [Stylosanthes scabra]|uniref:Uncharacterized protein n=1 Tax=Stylosanthes scabra TaxID=79078 RepID=A0ABU6ZTK3_9FABA|nr:hypothetical protein [Stylosanthes scabra]
MEDQRLEEVIRDICMPRARWKMSSSQPPHPIQLRRQDLTPVARVLAEGVQGRSKLWFPSTIYRLCKEAGVSMGEFKDTEKIQVAKPITAKVMTTIRGRIINNPKTNPWRKMRMTMMLKINLPTMIKTRKCILKLLELKKIITNTMINLTLRLMSPIFNNSKRTSNKDFSF